MSIIENNIYEETLNLAPSPKNEEIYSSHRRYISRLLKSEAENYVKKPLKILTEGSLRLDGGFKLQLDKEGRLMNFSANMAKRYDYYQKCKEKK